MGEIEKNAFTTRYPTAKSHKGTQYDLIYRVLTRKYHLLRNGREIGRYWTTDSAIHAIIRLETGFQSDELSSKLIKSAERLANQFGITYQGLGEE